MKILRLNKILAVLLTSGFTFTSQFNIANAATDGYIGRTSTGTKNISITIGLLAFIKNVDDAIFNTWDGAGDVEDSDDVCVYSNGGSNNYEVTAYGNGNANAFTVTDGNKSIPYSVAWSDNKGSDFAAGTTLIKDQITNSNFGGGSNPVCAKDNASVVVKFAESDLLASAVSGNSYQGTLTMIITAE